MQNIPNFVVWIIDMGLIQIWIIHDITYKLLHEKCHERGYHGDINYRV